MKRMLINATHGVRVALVEDQTLYDLEIERIQKQTVNSIYLGRVNRVEPSLGAAFVDFGSTRDGFLPIKEVAKEYFKPSYKHTPGERPNIKDVLEPGQEIIVQVVKEERGTKGAALRTFVSLAGRYLVLMPNNPRAGGISRQIEGEERDELRSNIDQLEIPDGMGIIVRTAGVGRSLEELQWDFEFLLSQWKAIKEAAASSRQAPYLIYKESDVITKALRDNLKPDIEEILIDNKQAYEDAKEHLTHTRPEFIDKLKFYDDSTDPLFNRYQVEAQIESAYQRVVGLPNGASIVIDPTEALTAIDINSAKATEGSDIEETALNTNIAAAKEIARQLRLRDLGGLIVIDFIDMNNPRHQREVEKHLREELKKDRARVQMGRITRFGLLEMSRQRLQPSLGDANQVTCPTCDGQGTIRGVESLSLSILRVIEEESMKAGTGQVRAQVPVDVATFLINEKRDGIIDLETRHSVNILIIANKNISIPHYEVSRIKRDEMARNPKASYNLATQKAAQPQQAFMQASASVVQEEEPAIKHIKPEVPAPPARIQKESGLIRRLWDAVFGGPEKEVEKLKPKIKQRDKKRSHHSSGSGSSGRHQKQSRHGGRNAHPKRGRSNNRNKNRRDNRHQDSQEKFETKPAENFDNNKPQNQADEPKHASEPKKENRQRRDRPNRKNRDNRSRDRKREHNEVIAVDMTQQARPASPEEKAMHQSQEVEKHEKTADQHKLQMPPVEASTNGHVSSEPAKQLESEIKAPSDEWSQTVPSIDEEPIIEAEAQEPQVAQKPKEPTYTQASRRDQIGFIKRTPEEAKNAFVEFSETQQPEVDSPKLKQVVTEPGEMTPLQAAPVSSLASKRPKKEEPKNDPEQAVSANQETTQSNYASTNLNTEES